MLLDSGRTKYESRNPGIFGTSKRKLGSYLSVVLIAGRWLCFYLSDPWFLPLLFQGYRNRISSFQISENGGFAVAAHGGSRGNIMCVLVLARHIRHSQLTGVGLNHFPLMRIRRKDIAHPEECHGDEEQG